MGGCTATFLYECPRAAPAPLVIFLVLQDQHAYIKYATIDTAAIVRITGVSQGITSYRLFVAFSAAVTLIASAYTGRPRYKHSEAVFFWGDGMARYRERWKLFSCINNSRYGRRQRIRPAVQSSTKNKSGGIGPAGKDFF